PARCAPRAAVASRRSVPRRSAPRRGTGGSSRAKDRTRPRPDQGAQPVVAFDKRPLSGLALHTPSPLHDALAALAAGRALSEAQAHAAFGAVMRGEATAAQIAALLMGLRVKGETAAEVAGAARALRAAMLRVEAAGTHLVDTCGTGGGAVPT